MGYARSPTIVRTTGAGADRPRRSLCPIPGGGQRLPGVRAPAAPQAPLTILPGDGRLKVPDFAPYEVEYTSAFGRFFNEVRAFDLEGTPKISVLNLIDTPNSVIVDHSIIDRGTLRQESGMTPLFAWGPEFLVYRATAEAYDLVRVPLAGGAPIHKTGALARAGFFEGLGFSPTLAAFLPLPSGTRFRIPRMQPRPDGSVDVVLVNMAVVGTESITTPAGVSCACTIVEETAEGGPTHRYWVSREAPFLFKRHRDIGGARDFVSEVLTFRHY